MEPVQLVKTTFKSHKFFFPHPILLYLKCQGLGREGEGERERERERATSKIIVVHKLSSNQTKSTEDFGELY